MGCFLEMKADVAVIGGGAAGLMTALTAAERGLSVVIAEPNEKLGRKLRITGKGRCNLTNACSVREFLQNVPQNAKFLYSVLNAFPPEETIRFFEQIGVSSKIERGKRVFPVSDSANDLADALVNFCYKRGVRVKKGRISYVEKDNDGMFVLQTDDGKLYADAVVICTGGKSYPATGSRGDGYLFAERFGHNIIPQRPSLIPLECEEKFCESLAGFAPKNVRLTAEESGKEIFSDLGEMLFTHFGVSGPLVLSASARMRFPNKCKLYIDFKPGLDEQALDERVLRDFHSYSNRDLINSLDDLLAKSFIPVFVRVTGMDSHLKVHDITREQRKEMVKLLKHFPLTIAGTRPIDEAIVTSGGVDVKEVNPRTMESKLVSGLFFAGEVLDVDAFTGGFNLQIAWSTARCAGLHVLAETRC